ADFTSFATGLKTPSGDVATFLSGQLSTDTQNLLTAWDPTVTPEPDAAIEQALISDLNSLIHGPLIWDPDPASNPFAGVTLRPETSELLNADLEGEKLARLNRMILEDAYSGVMTPKELPSLSSYAIDAEGRVNLNLSDGSQFTRGQILLQAFRDPQVLMKEGNNLFSGMGLAGGLERPVPPG